MRPPFIIEGGAAGRYDSMKAFEVQINGSEASRFREERIHAERAAENVSLRYVRVSGSGPVRWRDLVWRCCHWLLAPGLDEPARRSLAALGSLPNDRTVAANRARSALLL